MVKSGVGPWGAASSQSSLPRKGDNTPERSYLGNPDTLIQLSASSTSNGEADEKPHPGVGFSTQQVGLANGGQTAIVLFLSF